MRQPNRARVSTWPRGHNAGVSAPNARWWFIGAALAPLIALLCAAGYGWWHAATHATFEVQLVYKAGPNTANRLRSGQLEFLDAQDQVLARATIDSRRGVVWLAHPEKGQCGPALEREAQFECARAQAAWIPQWAGHVQAANITLERCSLARIPVNLYTRRDNRVLWWLPIANARGRPYTRHIATLTVHQRQCA